MHRLADENRLSSRSCLLADVLHDSFGDLTRRLPGDMFGLLLVAKPQINFTVNLRQSVSQAFVDSVYRETRVRYQAINGGDIPFGQIEMHCEGADVAPVAPDRVGEMHSVPLYLDGEVFAMLSMASIAEEDYGQEDLAMLSLVGDHMAILSSTLLRMQKFAMRDGLTGLFNRSLAEEEMKQTGKLMRRYDASMAIVVLDMDRFKAVNDTYGHAVGDRVLCKFADLLRKTARESDILARWGGDEFVAVLPYASSGGGQAFCERLLEETVRHLFCHPTFNLHLTVSMGMAASDISASPVSPEELLARADRMLYRAKRAGRNRACVWGQEVQLIEPAPGVKRKGLASAAASH